VRQAARRGPVVLVPSHKSHIDYIVISQAFLWNGLLPPHAAAGVNLDFFPVGPMLRRMGAYYIRRSFKGDAIYASVFRAYVRKLYREGFTQEFFIEGTRSRTGKTLPPKLGMLTMLVDAYLESKQPDAIFVPANISYEKLIESSSYLKELGGAEKEKENAAAFFKTANILASRYGRVFITFEEPISMEEFLASQGTSKEELASDEHDDKKRAVVRALAYRIVWGINSAVVVTANALAVLTLFGHRQRGVELEQVQATAALCTRHIHRVSEGRARFARGVDEDPALAVVRALDVLIAEGRVVKATAAEQTFYRIADDAFLELDFYKNNIIHFFVPEAIVACAMRSLDAKPGQVIARDVVSARARELSRVFKNEFIFRAGGFDVLFAAAVGRAAEYGVLVESARDLQLADSDEAKRYGAFAANLLTNFVDAYASVVRHLAEAAQKASSRKALILRLLDHARADVLAGAIISPEAVSKANIENALAMLEDLRVIEEKSGVTSVIAGRADELERIATLLAAARG
jgi:glycerol-3-phosphate O-acyltransferase